MDCEVLICRNTAARGLKMLQAMAQSAQGAGVRVHVTDRWRQLSPNLMTYGLGHPDRRPWQEAHKRAGGRLIGWDLGYWQRDVPIKFFMRLTIDDDHPHRWIRPMPADRWERAGIELREDADPDGPIVVVGMGRKQRNLLNLRGYEWELRTAHALSSRYPGRAVVYRPKRPEVLPGFPSVDGPIESALMGASLVVCGHSNVAVDACIAGIPVHCEDGAAFALFRDNPAPTRDQRLEFMRSLAWWQWNPREAGQAWAFIRGQLCG